jgi:hypothetical protein
VKTKKEKPRPAHIQPTEENQAMLSEKSCVVAGMRVSIIMLFLALLTPTLAYSQPNFSQTFSPNTIGPGSIATLRYTITNPEASPVTDLAFSNSLPAGVTIAIPGLASSECGGILTAPDGGDTATFSDGILGAYSTCTISINVTSATPGSHINSTGDLTSSAGNSGPAPDVDLTVNTGRPGFSKSFAPASISLGSRSTLTFTIDNALNPSWVFNITFSDSLPQGMVVADPANAATTCAGGTLTAQPGASIISYQFSGILNAGAVCTVSVDVAASAVGALANTTGEMTFTTGGPSLSSGKAGAVLSVAAEPLHLAQAFADDPVPPGATVALAFSITNYDRTRSAENISFSDDLDAALSGLVATGLPLSNPCGPGSALTGTSLLTLTGGSLGPEETCTFSVTLQVPAWAAPGAYPNPTSAISADIGGVPVNYAPGADTLFVSEAPILTKTFLNNPAEAGETVTVGAGETVTLKFTLQNTSLTSAATGIAFMDNLDAFLNGTMVTSLPPAGSCGAGSTVTQFTSIDRYLRLDNGNLPAGGSCTFQVVLLLPVGAPAGTYVNTTAAVTATVDGVSQTGQPASDTLTLAGGASLTKEFIDDPVLPGETVTLEFTLSLGEEAPENVTGITFSDDLNSTLAGLTAIGLPLNDICGPGSQLSGTTNLSFTGGTLTPGETCTFSVTLQVPPAALPGMYTNTTSTVASTALLKYTTTENPAQDVLLIGGGLTFTKDFNDDPVIPGEMATLEFTISNTSATENATAIQFTDNLASVLSGLVATGLPAADICGTGSLLSGTSNLFFAGGNLAPGTSCTFSVSLQVPAGAASGSYGNATSSLTASLGSQPITVSPATTELVVEKDLLQLTKVFTDDPVAPGTQVTLEFTLTNLDTGQVATDIAFSDDLNSTLAGLIAIGLPVADICGPGSQLSGTTNLSFTGGSLAPGASCTFSTVLDVPASPLSGSTAINTTSQATGTIGGLAVTGPPATDTLNIYLLAFGKTFPATARAGRTSVLRFSLQNLSTTSVSGLRFTDDLEAMFAGLVATGLPVQDICGPGSTLSGTGLLALTGGNLGPGESCTFDVELFVPLTAPHGFHQNITGILTADGLTVAGSASATMEINNDPDGDGLLDQNDNCPDIANADQANNDGDAMGDLCDPDDDNDGMADTADNCPFTANVDQANNDGDAMGDVCDPDDDNDTVADTADNCPFITNADQANNDGDALGDSCDPDDDNDTVADNADNCPFTANVDQANNDGDSQGDVCDPDDDNDGVADSSDNCPFITNADQANNDGDALGDPCDPDDDNDTVADTTDNCPFIANTDQANNDGDALGDSCDPDDDNDTVADNADNCPFIANTDQANNDGDGQGDICDPDDDNDGVADSADNCPFIANTDQADFNGDGTGDLCENDTDNDGMPNYWENRYNLDPFDPADAPLDNDGDGFTNLEEYRFGTDPNVFDRDDNNNGIPDSVDTRKGMIPAIYYFLNTDFSKR